MRIGILLVLGPGLGWGQLPAPVTERKITLEAALEMALKNNLEIEIERTNISTAAQALRAAHGAYDAIFRWQPGGENRNTPTSSVLASATGTITERFLTQNFSYLRRLPWQGSSFHVDFLNGRQSTNNPFVGLNPFTTSQLVVGYTMPLIRNRKVDRDRGEIRLRGKRIDISRTELELRAIDVASRVLAAYWDLAAAREDAQVKHAFVEWAIEQVARSKRMIDSGTLAPVELVAAEAELERRRDTYFAAVGLVTEIENGLKTLLASNRNEDIWNDALIPADERAPESRAAADLREAVTQALAKRPELRQISMRAETNAVEREMAVDTRKVRLDLNLTYLNSGLAGTENPNENPFARSNTATLARINQLSAAAGLPPISIPSFAGTPPQFVGGYGQVLSGVFGGNYQTFQAGLTMDFLLTNRAADAAIAQTAITERRLKLETQRVEQAIVAQVRNGLQAIETARQRIAAAEASARAAKEKMESETRLFQSGESTNFLVLTRQNEYADSLRRAVAARLDLNKAVARLQQATGTTLESYRLRVTE